MSTITRIVKQHIVKSPSTKPEAGTLELLFFDSGAVKISTYPNSDTTKARVLFLSEATARLVMQELEHYFGGKASF